MFPNLRVMLVALLASVLGIGCGLGAMAALRINHQPFTRAADGNPPLQLAYGTGTLAVVSDGTPSPFGVRFEINAPLSPREAIAVPASPPSDTPNAPISSADDQGAKAEARPEARANTAGTQANGQDDVHDDVPGNGKDSADAIVAELISDATAPQVAPQQTIAPVQTAAPAEAKPAQIAVPAEPPSAQIAMPNETAPVRVVSPAEPLLAVKVPAAEAPMTTAAITPDNKDVTPTFLGTLVSVPTAKTAAPKEARGHKAKHRKHARAASTAPDAANFAAPTFQPLLGSAAETPFTGQTPQPEPRRVVKRRHVAKKPAQATSTKPDTPATVATTKR